MSGKLIQKSHKVDPCTLAKMRLGGFETGEREKVAALCDGAKAKQTLA